MTAETFPGIADRLAGADGLLLALDFDGTLAPIEEDPGAPTLPPEVRRVVERFLAAPEVMVAVVSGRELADLRGRVDLDGVVYAGNHGLELAHDGRHEVHPTAQRHRPVVRRSLERVRDRLDGVPGWEIEDKGVTATVHVRGVPSDRVDEVRSAVAASVEAAGGDLSVNPGKQVFEIRPDVDWDKGATVDHLGDRVPDGWLTMYLGDDVTDEDAFRALRPDGVGVLVGSRDDTDATHRLSGQDAVAPFLEWVADRLFDGGRESDA